MSGQLTIDRASLERLHALASSAARLIGHIDALATSPLADHIDALAYELGELLGNPHLWHGRGAAIAVAELAPRLDLVLGQLAGLDQLGALTSPPMHP